MFPDNNTLEKKARQVLGVAPGAGVREIKKAYRRLARQYHPDCHPDPGEATARFLLITEAYEYLLRHKLPGPGSSLAGENNPEEGDARQQYARWWMEHFGDIF